MPALDAVRADNEVNRFPNGDPARAQKSVVRGSCDGEIAVAERYDFERTHRGFDCARFRFGADASQNLAEDEVSNKQLRSRHQGAKARNRVRDHLPQVVDPNRAVDDYHLSSRFSSRSRITSSQNSTLPERSRIFACCFNRTNVFKPSSMTARFVLRPVSFCAAFNSRSSISTLVRIGAPWCIKLDFYTHRRRGDANQP